MDSARKLLLYSSHAELLGLRWHIAPALEGAAGATMTAADAYALGVTWFNAIAELLRDAWGAEDLETFAELERGWSEILSSDDIWLPGFPGRENEYGFAESTGRAPSDHVVDLLRWREVLRLGLIMWGVWRLGKSAAPVDGQSAQVLALQQLASHFPSVEYVFDAYEAASDFDWKDRTPFTGWFLSELPTGVGHFIPTLNELLRTSLLLAVRLTGRDEPAELLPREWFVSRRGDVERQLTEVVDEGKRWAAVFGVSGQADTGLTQVDPVTVWEVKALHLRELLEKGEKAQVLLEQERVRTQPLDSKRVDAVRTTTLATAASAGALRALLRHQGAQRRVPRKPDDVEAQVARRWAPKSYFVAGSRVMAVDMIGRDLGEAAASAEAAQFVAALSVVGLSEEALATSPGQHAEEERLLADVQQVLQRMRDAEMDPSLIVTPISWRLREALNPGGFRHARLDHPNVPLAFARRLDGVIDGVPVIHLAPMPPDRLWILDLRRAIELVEWPSENDSGVRFELLSFSESEARAFTTAHPEVRGEQTLEDNVVDLQEKVLLSVYLCWMIQLGNPDAVRSLAVPPGLRREESSE